MKDEDPISPFDVLPQGVNFKNLNGVVIFESGVILNAVGKPFNQFIKKSDGKTSKSNCLKIAVQPQKGAAFRQFSVARLVAELFVPNPQNLRHVRHKDGNFKNCAVENLEWYDHASRANRRKMTEKELKAYVKEINVNKLSKVGEAIYKYLKGEKRAFVSLFLETGNQAYCYAIVKNALKDMFPNAMYSTDYVVKKIRDQFNDIVEGLILRGYFLPKEDCDDAVYWIYVRTHLIGLTKRYASSPREKKN